ncbi:MAG: glycosyltransferase [Acetobacteraceae bacterium]|nr:glycosyltransferase [Acetobacteraceae bacterium]
MRVLHVVADGDPGWAATAALAVIDATPAARGVRHALVTETGSPLAAAARARGIPTATRAFQRRRRFGGVRPRLVETVWEMAPDVVHAHGIQAAYAVLPAAHWLGLPIVLAMPAVAPPRGSWLARLARRIERGQAVRGAAVLLFGTRAALAEARQTALVREGRRALVAPPPIDLALLPERRTVEPVLLLQGRIHADFPAARVVAAMQGAPDTTSLCVLAEGPGADQLREALCDAGLSDRVDWQGPLARHEALARLARAAAVIDPRMGSGVPIGLIEAAAVGVPVIAPARTALVEALGIEGISEAAPDSAWSDRVREVLAGRHGVPRAAVRDWIAQAHAAEQHLRAWEMAVATTHAGLPAASGLRLRGPAGRAA